MSTTVDSLYASQLGRPIVVVGGGPNAPKQLHSVQHLLDHAVIIFANGHGFKLGLEPDYIVCKDDVHTETKEKMEPLLRANGDYPIVSRHPWADILLQNWPTQGNSGQLAIGFAAFLGGKPIIPIGFDCYLNGTYFHDPHAKNVSGGRRDSPWRSSMTRLKLRLEGAVIRPPGGFLRFIFPEYSATEVLPEPTIPLVFNRYKPTDC